MNNFRNKTLLGIFSASITVLTVIGHAESVNINNNDSEFAGTLDSYSHKNIIKPVYFDSGKAIIQSGEFDKLEALINQNASKSSLRVVFVGHTDNQNLSENSKSIHNDNFELSTNRAQVVMNDFQQYIGNRENVLLSYVGVGPSQPVASNQSQQGMSLNRRVEVHFIYNTREELQNSLATINGYSENSSTYLSADDSITIDTNPHANYVKTGELAKLENVAPKACVGVGGCSDLESIDGPIVIESKAANNTIEQAIEKHANSAAKQNANAKSISALTVLTALGEEKQKSNTNEGSSFDNTSSVKLSNDEKPVKVTIVDKVIAKNIDVKALKSIQKQEALTAKTFSSRDHNKTVNEVSKTEKEIKSNERATNTAEVKTAKLQSEKSETNDKRVTVKEAEVRVPASESTTKIATNEKELASESLMTSAVKEAVKQPVADKAEVTEVAVKELKPVEKQPVVATAAASSNAITKSITSTARPVSESATKIANVKSAKLQKENFVIRNKSLVSKNAEVRALESQKVAKTTKAEEQAAIKRIISDKDQSSKAAACGGYAYGGCYDLALKSDFKFREVLKVESAVASKTMKMASLSKNASVKMSRSKLVQKVVKQDATKSLAGRKLASTASSKESSSTSASKEVREKSVQLAMLSFKATKVETKKEIVREVPVVKKEVPVVKKEVPVVKKEIVRDVPVVEMKKTLTPAPMVEMKR